MFHFWFNTFFVSDEETVTLECETEASGDATGPTTTCTKMNVTRTHSDQALYLVISYNFTVCLIEAVFRHQILVFSISDRNAITLFIYKTKNNSILQLKRLCLATSTIFNLDIL